MLDHAEGVARPRKARGGARTGRGCREAARSQGGRHADLARGNAPAAAMPQLCNPSCPRSIADIEVLEDGWRLSGAPAGSHRLWARHFPSDCAQNAVPLHARRYSTVTTAPSPTPPSIFAQGASQEHQPAEARFP